MTGANTIPLRERMKRAERVRDLDADMKELLAIGRRCADLLDPGPSTEEHGDFLYDERGLPR